MRNKKWQVTILSLVILIGAYIIANSLFSDHKVPQVGDKAPDFKLLGLDGEVHQLADYKGKTLVVNFWGTYCPPCKAEMPAIQKQYEKWQPSDVVVLAINMGESPITVHGFLDPLNTTFPVLLDEDFEIRKNYGVIQYPTTFFVKPNGRIANIHVGGMSENDIHQSLSAMIGS